MTDKQVAVEHHQGVAVVRVRGEVDLATSPLLRETLEPVLESEAGSVVVDLFAVAFMDSTGVHALVETLRRLESQHRRFAIACRENGQVHRVLDLLGLLDALPVHRSRESALTGGDDLLTSRPAGYRRASDSRALRLGPTVVSLADHRAVARGADRAPAFD